MGEASILNVRKHSKLILFLNVLSADDLTKNTK